MELQRVLSKESFSKDEIKFLLQLENRDEIEELGKKAYQIKKEFVGNVVYYRGLIEFSNICTKDCYYCGIRKGNAKVNRYQVTYDEILEAAKFAWENKYGSIVLQSGERSDPKFIDLLCSIVSDIKKLSNYELGITLSCGEQSLENYQRLFDAGAHRYLLRIETSNPVLYKKLHPNNADHSFDTRIECIKYLRKAGFQVGSGVMAGLPFQSIDDLVEDILFFKEYNVDMLGIGPYIEHSDTPLYEYSNQLLKKEDRFYLCLKMIAILRIMLKDINIASTTAMQALHLMGREKGLRFGANIIMPNITPLQYKGDYLLYEDKPCIDEDSSQCKSCLEIRIKMTGDEIGYGLWGDSKHFVSENKGDAK